MLRPLSFGLIALASASAVHAGTIIEPAHFQAQPLAESSATTEAIAATAGNADGGVDNQALVKQGYSRLNDSQLVARVTPPQPSSQGSDKTYQPKTQYDNTPYRFNMSQGGKQMTAEEFDAWMKSRGLHVVKARPSATGTTTSQPATVQSGSRNK